MTDFTRETSGLFTVSDSGDGIHTVRVENHQQFTQLLGEGHFLEHPEYVFRGHVNPSWELLPSLYRRIKDLDIHVPGDNKGQVLNQRQRAGIQTAAVLRHFLQGLRRTEWHEADHELLLDWFAQAGQSPHIDELRKAAAKQPSLWDPARGEVYVDKLHQENEQFNRYLRDAATVPVLQYMAGSSTLTLNDLLARLHLPTASSARPPDAAT